MKLEISLFKFDCKSDYLPYYTKHYLKMDKEQTLLDIFNTINEEHPLSYDSRPESYVVVNGIYINIQVTCAQLRETFGSDLCLEPLSIKHANHDFEINDGDFQKQFELLSKFTGLEMLDAFVDKDIQAIYQSYKPYFYASNTFSVEANYVGDAVLLLASDLCEKFPKQEAAILKTLEECDYGIENHTSLENRIFNLDASIEEKISLLKQKLNLSKAKEEQNFRVNTTKILDFGSFNGSCDIQHDFSKFNLAYFSGTSKCEQTQSLLNKLNAKQLSLRSLSNDLAEDTFHVNPKLSYRLAAQVMLDAFDNGADLIIVHDDQTFYLLDYNRKNLEKISGREINIPIIHKHELEKLAVGDHESVKKTLENHVINPEII